MSTPDFYTQCMLSKETSEGRIFQHSWIPKIFAKLNNIVRLKEENGWSDGWKVEKVYSTEESKVIVDIRDGYRNFRKITDI